MKATIIDWKGNARELTTSERLVVELDNGQIIEVAPKDDHVEIRTPNGMLIQWPDCSNTIKVESVAHTEAPGMTGRAFTGTQSRRFHIMELAGRELFGAARRVLEQVSDMDTYPVRELKQRLEGWVKAREHNWDEENES